MAGFLQEAGIYVDSLKTVLGCDSIYELQLSVNPLFRDTLKAVICEGQRYQDAGFNESEAGFYEKHYKTVNGCDSIVCLNLKVNSFFTGGIWSVLEDCATHSYRFEPEWKGIQTDKEGYRFLWDFGDGQTGEGGIPASSICRFRYLSGTFAGCNSRKLFRRSSNGSTSGLSFF